MRSTALLLATIIVLVSTGCGGTVKGSQLVGRYSLESASLQAQLELRDDGTFVQSVSQGGSAISNTGTWKLDEDLQMLVLTDALQIQGGQAVREWIVTLPVVKSYRTLKLQTDKNSGAAYVKQ